MYIQLRSPSKPAQSGFLFYIFGILTDMQICKVASRVMTVNVVKLVTNLLYFLL